LWLHSLKVAQLLRSAACLHTNQSRSYLNHLVVVVVVVVQSKGKGKAVPVQTYYRRRGLQEDEDSRFRENRHLKVARFSDLRTGRLNLPPPENISFIHFCQRPGRPQGHNEAGIVMSMKNNCCQV